MFKIKRVYEEEGNDDGVRVLIDRVWPRGVSKEKADLDEWFKDAAPSTELRKWFNHETDKFSEFKEKYKEELKTDGEKIKAVSVLLDLNKDRDVTLLYGAKDQKINHAVVLKEYLTEIAD